MKEICDIYTKLFEEFLAENLPVDDFEAAYFMRFKNETQMLDDRLYDVLEDVFGDLDSFTHDAELSADKPDFYLDEPGLRRRVRRALERLLVLSR